MWRKRRRAASDMLAEAARAAGWSVVPPAEAAATLGPLVTWKPARQVMVRHGDAGDYWFTWHFWISHHLHGRAVNIVAEGTRTITSLAELLRSGA